MSRWSFEPVLDSYGLVVALCLTLILVVLAIRPWVTGQSRRVWILIALRIVLVGLLAIAMLRPAHVSTDREPQSATLVVLFDQSRSMSVQDLTGNRSRWQQLTATLTQAAPELAALSDIIEVHIYGFDHRLDSNVRTPEDLQLPRQPLGEQTDLAAAIQDSLQSETGKRLAGVIVLSDGAQRVDQPRLDVQQTVRELTRTRTPLYTVAFGKPRDQSQARDVAIEQLSDQYTVFVKNELEIRGSLRVQGYVNRAIPIKVVVEGPEGVAPQTLGPTSVRATQDDQLVDFQFVFSPEVAGAYTLRVDVQPQEGELVVSNNQMNVYVNVLEGGIRILYLEGNLLGPEQQILRRSLGGVSGY